MAVLPNIASGQATFTTCIGDIGNCDASASSINLGPATVGGGAFVPVKITNTGPAALTINYSFTSAAFAFGLSQTLPPNPLTIAPGASVQTFIVFLPTSAGPQAGQFVSNDNAPGSPHVIPLSGVGVNVAAHDFADWAPLFVRWEIGLLNELGFGLDLARCAATGMGDDLIYVSPRTGRAVSRGAGEPYRERLLPLPAFLLGRQAGDPRAADLHAGLQLTAHFLDQWLLMPHDKMMPEARTRLTDLAARAATESA